MDEALHVPRPPFAFFQSGKTATIPASCSAGVVDAHGNIGNVDGSKVIACGRVWVTARQAKVAEKFGWVREQQIGKLWIVSR